MVSKAKSTKGSSQAIDYLMNDKEKGEALILDRNGIVGTTGKDILQEFRFVQDSNRNCVNNTISMVISPNQEIGKNLSNKELSEILHSQLENLGLKDRQYIATVHTSTETKHIHVIINRINEKGQAISDSFLSKRAQDSAEKIAKSKGWKTAKDIQNERKLEAKDIRLKVENSIKKDKPQDIKSYFESLHRSGLKIDIIRSKVNNTISGYRIEGFKASDISRNLTLNKVEKSIKTIINSLSKDRGYSR